MNVNTDESFSMIQCDVDVKKRLYYKDRSQHISDTFTRTFSIKKVEDLTDVLGYTISASTVDAYGIDIEQYTRSFNDLGVMKLSATVAGESIFSVLKYFTLYSNNHTVLNLEPLYEAIDDILYCLADGEDKRNVAATVLSFANDFIYWNSVLGNLDATLWETLKYISDAHIPVLLHPLELPDDLLLRLSRLIPNKELIRPEFVLLTKSEREELEDVIKTNFHSKLGLHKYKTWKIPNEFLDEEMQVRLDLERINL